MRRFKRTDPPSCVGSKASRDAYALLGDRGEKLGVIERCGCKAPWQFRPSLAGIEAGLRTTGFHSSDEAKAALLGQEKPATPTLPRSAARRQER